MKSFRVLTVLFLSLLASPTTTSPIELAHSLRDTSPVPRSPLEARDFTNAVVFTPPSTYTSWQTLYGRSAQLTDGSLLTTWEE